MHRIRSLASLRSRARTIMFEDSKLLVAALSDVIRSKRAAGRPRDNAVLQILEKALREEEYKQKGETRSVKEGKCAGAARPDQAVAGPAAGQAHTFSAKKVGISHLVPVVPGAVIRIYERALRLTIQCDKTWRSGGGNNAIVR